MTFDDHRPIDKWCLQDHLSSRQPVLPGRTSQRQRASFDAPIFPVGCCDSGRASHFDDIGLSGRVRTPKDELEYSLGLKPERRQCFDSSTLIASAKGKVKPAVVDFFHCHSAVIRLFYFLVRPSSLPHHQGPRRQTRHNRAIQHSPNFEPPSLRLTCSATGAGSRR
jgi:hypothetical protein